MYFGGLQGVLLLPCDINPFDEGGTGLLVVLQLRQIQLQILESEQEQEKEQRAPITSVPFSRDTLMTVADCEILRKSLRVGFSCYKKDLI